VPNKPILELFFTNLPLGFPISYEVGNPEEKDREEVSEESLQRIEPEPATEKFVLFTYVEFHLNSKKLIEKNLSRGIHKTRFLFLFS